MFNQLVSQSTIPIAEQAAAFAHARHALLAGNVANFDTPGYLTRDLSVEEFQTRLQEAIEARRAPPVVSPGSGPLGIQALESTREGTDREADPLRKVKESLKHILFHDGSDVSVEHQVAEISKNAHLHQVAVQIMRSQFGLLQTAVAERIV